MGPVVCLRYKHLLVIVLTLHIFKIETQYNSLACIVVKFCIILLAIIIHLFNSTIDVPVATFIIF